MSADYPWMQRWRALEGMAEVPGLGVNPAIRNLWLSLKNGAAIWKQYGGDDSKLPWCGAGAAHVMDFAGIAYPANYARARAWLDWGDKLNAPVYGCVVVFGRGNGAGHVGNVEALTTDGRLLVWGANQGDKICLKPFEIDRVLGYRWPSSVPEPRPPAKLRVLAWAGASSRNEA